MPTSGSAALGPWALGNFFPIWIHFPLNSGSILSGWKTEPKKPLETSCYFVLRRHQVTARRYLIFSAVHMAFNLINLWSWQQKMKFWSLEPSGKTPIHFMRVRIQPMEPVPDAPMQNNVMGWLVLKCLPGLDNCSYSPQPRKSLRQINHKTQLIAPVIFHIHFYGKYCFFFPVSERPCWKERMAAEDAGCSQY